MIDIKDLQALLKLCRKQGVIEITSEGLSIKFGDLPKKESGDKEDSEEEPIPTDGLTPEQMLFYSAPPLEG